MLALTFHGLQLSDVISLLGHQDPVPQTGWLTQQKWTVSLLEAWKSKTKVLVSWLFLRAVMENVLHAPGHVLGSVGRVSYLPASSGLLAIFGIAFPHGSTTCLHLLVVFSLHMCLCPNFPLL